MFLQREAVRRRITEAEFQLRRGIEAAVGEIAARLGASARRKCVLEEFRSELHHVVKRLTPRIAHLVFARGLGQRHAGHLCQPLDCFREANTFRLHDEIEDAAVLAGGEIEPGLLLVVHEEGRRFLLVERRQALPLASRAHKFNALADDFRDRQPGFQLIEELRRKAHSLKRIVSRCDRGASWSGGLCRIGLPILRRQIETFRDGTAKARLTAGFAPFPSYPQALRTCTASRPPLAPAPCRRRPRRAPRWHASQCNGRRQSA